MLSKWSCIGETKIEITEDQKNIVYQSKKLLLFDKGSTWMKKRRDLFGVAMKPCDGVEVCKLVGTFLLEKITEICYNVKLDSIGITFYLFMKRKQYSTRKIKKQIARII